MVLGMSKAHIGGPARPARPLLPSRVDSDNHATSDQTPSHTWEHTQQTSKTVTHSASSAPSALCVLCALCGQLFLPLAHEGLRGFSVANCSYETASHTWEHTEQTSKTVTDSGSSVANCSYHSHGRLPQGGSRPPPGGRWPTVTWFVPPSNWVYPALSPAIRVPRRCPVNACRQLQAGSTRLGERSSKRGVIQTVAMEARRLPG